jgi:pilus assembly protein Flp/PilA
MTGRLFSAREIGQGLMEYALVLVLIAVVAAVILGIMGDSLGNTYTGILSQLPFH